MGAVPVAGRPRLLRLSFIDFFNPYTKKREYAPNGATPGNNPYTKQRELVGRD
jgi:hypothetical protein